MKCKSFRTYITGSIAFGVTLLVGCVLKSNIDIPKEAARNADDLLVIDCLLPGQVRKLGSYSTYLTARRPIKTNATDCEIRGGEYVAFDRADYATALKIWLPVAQSGDPEAQTYVGEIYEKGLGLQPDYSLAVNWYTKAAEQHFSRAQINLGNLYEKGLGVIQDKAIALNWYRRASGMKNDDLLYASTVTVNSNAQKELDTLKEVVRSKNEQLESLRSRLARTQRELKDRKLLLNKAKNTQKQKEHELFAQESKAIHEQSREIIKALRLSLSKAKAEVAAEKSNLATLTYDAESMSNDIESASEDINQSERLVAANGNAPSIEIIDPPMALMRGVPTIRLRAGTKEKEIVGKIKASSGIKGFKVNDKPTQVDDYSLFWVNIPMNAIRTSVTMEAIDKKGRSVTFDFSLVTAKKQLGKSVRESYTAAIRTSTNLNLGKYYALIIGNNRYAYYPDLVTPKNDVTETEEILREKFGFDTILLLNATRYDILSALNTLRTKLTKGDNLLIYYAGHGELDDVNSRGYWLPVDAEPGSTANWISNVSISDILNTIPAKHVLVVADSCYAGTLSMASVPRINEVMTEEAQDEWIKIMSKARARTVLTSGGVAPVLDGGGSGHSIFSQAFLSVLNQIEGITEGHAIYRNVLSKVRRRALELNHDQVPEYAPVRYAGHEAGEFFFQSL